MSHAWGVDRGNRDNRKRVNQIAQALQARGLYVFGDWEHHKYHDIDEAMVDGMRESSLALVFLTRSYIAKIEQAKVEDDCVAQFNLAKRAPNIIPVVMEPDLCDSAKWGWSSVHAF